MNERKDDHPETSPKPAVTENPADMVMGLRERIQRSREIMAELDGRLAASRDAELRAAEREDRERARNPVRVRRSR